MQNLRRSGTLIKCIQSNKKTIMKKRIEKHIKELAPVVQRPDNFIQRISHYPTVSICAKILVFPRVQANMHTLTTAKFESVQKPWTMFNMKYILDPE